MIRRVLHGLTMGGAPRYSCRWTQLVKGPPCHGGIGECDPRHRRQLRGVGQQLDRLLWRQEAVGASPTIPTIMLSAMDRTSLS